MKELITKNLEVKDKINYEFEKTFDSYESILLSKPIALRVWSSFFVILPIFVQAPWVRLEPISALCFTFVILSVAYFLHKKKSNIGVKLRAFDLLKYCIRSFLKHALN